MRDNRKVKINRKKFVPFILFVVTSLILITMLYQYMNQRKMINDLKSNTSILKNQSNELKNEIQKLTEEIEKVNSLDYIEKKAREDLGMIKKGEKIYIDENESKDEETSNETKGE